MKTSFKEWNAVIEAIGEGKQDILIRKNSILIKEFLLYPTVSYVNNDDFLDMFQKKYHDFVKDNLLPDEKNGAYSVKYLIKIKKIEKISPKILNSIEKRSIYSKNHVKSYLGSGTGFIWYLETYKLPKVFFAKTKKQAITFAKLDKDIPIENIIKIK